jgi:hypothetical protein
MAKVFVKPPKMFGGEMSGGKYFCGDIYPGIIYFIQVKQPGYQMVTLTQDIFSLQKVSYVKFSSKINFYTKCPITNCPTVKYPPTVVKCPVVKSCGDEMSSYPSRSCLMLKIYSVH